MRAGFGFGQGALYAQFVIARQFDVLVLLYQLDDAHRLDRRVFLEADADQPWRCVHLEYAVGFGQHTQTVHVDQGLPLWRQLAKAVHDLFGQAVDLVAILGSGQLFVKAQAQMHVAAVVVRQKRGRMQIDLGRGVKRAEQIRLDAGFEAAHRFGQHFVVELKAHFQHIATLVFAQHFARAANLQIVHSQVKAAAQFFHLLNRVQALTGLFGQAFQVGHHQVGISLVVAAAHASAQLVQLRQAKFIRPANHNGVGRGYINSGFDDGRAQQNVVALGHKVAHHRLELSLGHLAVRYRDARLGQ